MLHRILVCLCFVSLAACGTNDTTGAPTDTGGGDDTSTSDPTDTEPGEDTPAEDAADDTPSEDGPALDAPALDTPAMDSGEDAPEDSSGEDTAADTAACEDGETSSIEVVCEDGRVARGECVCVAGELECGPNPCESQPPELCSNDSECDPTESCDPCGTSSCPDCDDCVAACLTHGCETEVVLTCRMLRPECEDGQVAIVEDGCWVCVDFSTCEPPASSESECEAAGHGCYDRRCPRGTSALRLSCEPTGGVCCAGDEPAPSDCESSGATCVDDDVCPDGSSRIRSSCDPTGGICCLEDDEPARECDDGSELLCDMSEPTCEAGSVAAVQATCWVCVNSLTCRGWGEAGCESGRDCDRGEVCDECATSSCPDCDDCVAACVRRAAP